MVARCAVLTRPPSARFHSGAYDCFAAICRIVSRLRPCGDGVLKEPWAAGAAPAGGSSSPGHSAAAVPVGLWNPPFPNMGFCSRPGEDPNAWKHFGPKPARPDTQSPHQAVWAARDSGTGITGGGSEEAAIWRTPVSPIRGWTSVTLKINTQSNPINLPRSGKVWKPVWPLGCKSGS